MVVMMTSSIVLYLWIQHNFTDYSFLGNSKASITVMTHWWHTIKTHFIWIGNNEAQEVADQCLSHTYMKIIHCEKIYQLIKNNNTAHPII